jgi:hypothetical protein
MRGLEQVECVQSDGASSGATCPSIKTTFFPDVDRLCRRLQAGTVEELRRNLAASLDERIARGELKRQGCWTESLAVGSLEFVKQIQPLILSRRETDIVGKPDQMCVLRESAPAYGQEIGLKNAAKV